MRYGKEALRVFLPKRVANRWDWQTTSLQLSLGVNRDVMQAGESLAKLGADRGLVDVHGGAAIGQSRSRYSFVSKLNRRRFKRNLSLEECSHWHVHLIEVIVRPIDNFLAHKAKVGTLLDYICNHAI